MSFKSIVITYLIGGLTLPPLLVIGVLYLLSVTLPYYVEDKDDQIKEYDDDLSEFSNLEYKNLKMTEIEDLQTSGVKAFKAGWITVTREYHTFVTNSNDKQLENKENEPKSAYTALYRLVKNNKKSNQSNDTVDTSVSSPAGSTTNVEKNMKKAVRRKNRYFGVLRHGNLFLYKDENQQDVQHVIVLSNNIVTLWPRDLRDGELYTKRSAICILKRNPRRNSDLPPKDSSASLNYNNDIESTLDILKSGVIPPKSMGFFIYCDTNYEKEDWYFELIKATKRENFQPTGTDLDLLEPSIYANALHFKTADMINLIQTLHSSEGQLQTRWLNALIGRLFLSVQFTEYFEDIVRTKLLKKLAKINKPGFLDEIKVKKIDVGNSAPFISFPKLIELNPDGTLKLSMKFSYTGKLSLQVATKVNINLGSHFKTREVSILLAVTLNKLEGPLLVNVKSPPSTRIWYTFESMPTMDLKIEPVVSQRQITYGMITKVIENKFREGIKESLVQPHWDDITFFDTSEEIYRGGIWDTTKRPDNDTHSVSDPEEEEILGENEIDGNSEFGVDDGGIESPTSTSGNDFSKLPDDASSVRSRGTLGSNTVRSKASFTNSITSAKKTNPTISTSNEQFLSNGSFVSKESSAPSSPTKELNKSDETLSERERIGRNSTMQLLSEEASASKKTISNSFKKIGKWYEKNRNSSSNTLKTPETSGTTKHYTPPEMIQSRRRTHSSTSHDSPRAATRSTSNGDLRSVESQESYNMKAAPQAHTFPAEYLYGLETKEPDSEVGMKHNLPPKIPEMKSPYANSDIPTFKEEDSSSQKKVFYPRRKPVEEDLAASTPIETNTGAKAVHAVPPPLSSSGTTTTNTAPPPLPKRDSSEVLETLNKKDPEVSKSVGNETLSSISSNLSIPPPLPAREISAALPNNTDNTASEDVTEEREIDNGDSQYNKDLEIAIQESLMEQEEEKFPNIDEKVE